MVPQRTFCLFVERSDLFFLTFLLWAANERIDPSVMTRIRSFLLVHPLRICVLGLFEIRCKVQCPPLQPYRRSWRMVARYVVENLFSSFRFIISSTPHVVHGRIRSGRVRGEGRHIESTPSALVPRQWIGPRVTNGWISRDRAAGAGHRPAAFRLPPHVNNRIRRSRGCLLGAGWLSLGRSTRVICNTKMAIE